MVLSYIASILFRAIFSKENPPRGKNRPFNKNCITPGKPSFCCQLKVDKGHTTRNWTCVTCKANQFQNSSLPREHCTSSPTQCKCFKVGRLCCLSKRPVYVKKTGNLGRVWHLKGSHAFWVPPPAPPFPTWHLIKHQYQTISLNRCTSH